MINENLQTLHYAALDVTYDKAAAELAWKRGIDFFERQLN